jgi:hypothetical protein
MCPINEESSEWHLADICIPIKINRMFDNQFTVLFSLIINCWGILKLLNKFNLNIFIF